MYFTPQRLSGLDRKTGAKVNPDCFGILAAAVYSLYRICLFILIYCLGLQSSLFAFKEESSSPEDYLDLESRNSLSGQ